MTGPVLSWERRQRFACLEEASGEPQKLVTEKRLECAPRSPAYTMPDDIWIKILLRANVHQFPECHTEHYDMDKLSMPISHASRYFRHLTLALPTLWTCLHVTPGRLGRSGRDWLEERLRRSGSAPLTIMFSCHRVNNDEQPFWEDWGQLMHRKEFGDLSYCWNELLQQAHRALLVRDAAVHGRQHNRA